MMTFRKQFAAGAGDVTVRVPMAAIEVPLGARGLGLPPCQHIVAKPEFIGVWLSKALVANAIDVVPALAAQHFAVHLGQLARSWGATKLSLGPANVAPSAQAIRTVSPAIEILPTAALMPGSTIEVTSDLSEFFADIPRDGQAETRHRGSYQVMFRDGMPTRFDGAAATTGAILSRLGLAEGFAALVLARRQLERQCLGASDFARKRALDVEWSVQVSTLGWFHPRRRELDGALAHFARRVAGEAQLTLPALAGASASSLPCSGSAPIGSSRLAAAV